MVPAFSPVLWGAGEGGSLASHRPCGPEGAAGPASGSRLRCGAGQVFSEGRRADAPPRVCLSSEEPAVALWAQAAPRAGPVPRGLGTSPGRCLKESSFLSALRFRRSGRKARAWGSYRLCVRASVRELYCLVHGISSTKEARRSRVSHLRLSPAETAGRGLVPLLLQGRGVSGAARQGALWSRLGLSL